MLILDGKSTQSVIVKKLTNKISTLKTKPKLVIIQIGNLPESNTYIRQKVLFGKKIGAIVEHQKLEEKVTQSTLNAQLSTLNSNKSVNGIIVQLPISQRLNKNEIVDSINPAKDVDGQSAANVKKLIDNDPSGFVPATTKGILTLLDNYNIGVSGKNAVVVGRSSLVGKPTALALLNQNATVTICHSQTKNLKSHTRAADILIVAAGKPNLITADHVSKRQIVVDVGINVLNQPNKQSKVNHQQSKKLVGDVDYDEVSKIVSAITPVPGGIGPMTVASLFENLLEAYTHQR